MSEKGDRRRALAEELDRMAARHPEHSVERLTLQTRARRMRGLARHADKMSTPAAGTALGGLDADLGEREQVLASPDAGERRIH
jgi:hypothetical protein